MKKHVLTSGILMAFFGLIAISVYDIRFFYILLALFLAAMMYIAVYAIIDECINLREDKDDCVSSASSSRKRKT